MEGGLTFYSCALAASGRHLAPYMAHVLHAKVQLQPLLAYCAVPCVDTCLLSADTMLARRSMPLRCGEGGLFAIDGWWVSLYRVKKLRRLHRELELAAVATVPEPTVILGVTRIFVQEGSRGKEQQDTAHEAPSA